MTTEEFHRLLDATLSFVEDKAASDPDYYTKSGGESFEPKVVEAVKVALDSLRLDANVRHTQGGHAFPDIVLECPDGNKFGIEVKSTKSNQWKINGNSVMGSTSADGIIETYIFFGKLVHSAPEFMVRRYEDCISDVAVTHSPRYKIDMELPLGETFFDKSGIPYETIKNSDDPISLVKEYYREQGSTAWWLTESAPPVIKLFNELSNREKEKFCAYGFTYFPEILSSEQDKYHNFAVWLIAEHSIIATNLRDFFSASGQVNFSLNGNTYVNVPRVYKKLLDAKSLILDVLDKTPPETLKNHWNCEDDICDDLNDKIDAWLTEVKSRNLQNNESNSLDTYCLVNDIFDVYS